MERNSICIIEMSEQEEAEQEIENVFEEIMPENVTDLGKKKSHKSRNHRESQKR